MLKQLPPILLAGRITQLCHPWVLQKSTHLWPGITFLNQTKMSSACRAITVNVRERHAGSGRPRKTRDEPFHQHAMNTGTAVIKQCFKPATDRMWQIQTTGYFFFFFLFLRDMATNIYVRESKFVSCLTLISPIWWKFLLSEPLIKYMRSSLLYVM